MTELLTAAQMQAIERAAMASGVVRGLDLMERAGQGMVDAIIAHWPHFGAGIRRAAVLCGPGNNGGDGFVVARLLRARGWDVDVFLYGDPARLPPDARVNHDRWSAAGHTQAWAAFDAAACKVDLIIDAVFGTGLSRPLPGQVARSLDLAATQDRTHTKLVAADIPSGLCADSGRTLGGDVICDSVVTFHAPKLGHVLGQGAQLCPSLDVVDIGLALPEPTGGVPLVDQGWLARAALPRLVKSAAAHKFDHGHALVLTGGPGRTGAARLAARAALRVGAGLVTLGVPPAAQMEVASQITALMLARVPDAAALAALLEDARLNALCVGPGLGLGADQERLVHAALHSGRPCVLDADALTLLSRSGALWDALHEGCILTPHGGEFARLFPDLADRLTGAPRAGPAFSKVDAAYAAAERAGCTILFKGADTVIAAPDGRVSVHAALRERAAPWLATAGAGDVLAGLITGLLARGLGPAASAEAAAWLHAECALDFGPGLIAEDLPEALPAVLRRLQATAARGAGAGTKSSIPSA